MGLLDYFKPVRTLSAEEVRVRLDTHPLDACNLVDVRQPAEYRKGHLPGAVLIPVGDLAARRGELDGTKPTIAY